METNRTAQELSQGEIIRNQFYKGVIDYKEANKRLDKFYLMI